MEKNLISNIQRFSLDDGPGIRTTVFFKGCNLSCLWCHNPECISLSPSLYFENSSCTHCGRCSNTCPEKAHQFIDNTHSLLRERCTSCGACTGVCPSKALKIVGKEYEAEILLKEILKDKVYYKNSGGGVTFSGGEPALFFKDIIPIALLCKKAGLHIALDTAGNVPFANYEALLSCVDVFLYDIKCFTSDLHHAWTGVHNPRILENLQKLDAHKASYTIRVPIIPHFNSSLQEQEHIASFLASLKNISLIELLPYHNYGLGKYKKYGLENVLPTTTGPDDNLMQSILHIYKEKELSACIR